MPSFNDPGKIIITCSKRLSQYLQAEIVELGFKVERVFSTGVELHGSLNDCIRLNLNLCCASQILYSLDSFKCNNPDQLYKSVLEIPWEKILMQNGYFSVTSFVDDPTINNSLFANVKVKDAIVDRFRNKVSVRPDTGPQLQHAVIHLFWRSGVAEIFIDTSGETLSKHGYRKIPGQAPMLESLAAATLLAAKWDRKSTFINPMCGSSTIAIEAAMMATNRKPGLFRNNYSFMHINGYDENFYTEEKKRLNNQIVNEPNIKIIASDISGDAINISKINANAAGVGDLIHFMVCDFQETEIPDKDKGVIFLNPEYGERMGNKLELEETYKTIGDFLKQKCGGYMAYIFTGNLELAKKVGLRSSRKIEFYNSKIDCRLLEYELYAGSRRTDKDIQ